MKIALDAFGGDNAPGAIIEGARIVLDEIQKGVCDLLEIALVGNIEKLDPFLTPDIRDRVELVDVPLQEAPDQSDPLEEGENPDSAMRIALAHHREGLYDAVVSAGSTGTQVVSSLLELEKCPGITRPAVGSIIPSRRGRCFLLDVGASLVATPHHLVQFAAMGSVYAKHILGIENPRIALLNVAKEKTQGERSAVQAYSLLAKTDFNFIGFIEGREIAAGEADVIVTNGFVGNVLLKYTEGLPMLFESVFSKTVSDNINRELEARMDYQLFGGEPLLGVQGVSIICHGASNGLAISAAIKKAAFIARMQLPKKIQVFLETQFDSYLSQVRYLRSFRRSLRSQWRSTKKPPLSES